MSSSRRSLDLPPSLVSTLRDHARDRAEIPAYVFLNDGETEGARWTYAEVDRRARAVASQLQTRELAGERALLLLPPGLDFIAAFLGCLYAGTIAVPAYPPASRRHWPRLQAIAEDARPAVALTESGILPRLRRAAGSIPGLETLPWISVDAVDFATADTWRPHAPAADDLAFLQYTSGSTAKPKGVMVTHGNLMHNEASIARAFGQTADSVVVGWLPVYHDMGLIGNVLQPLFLGARCVLMSPVAFLQKPLRWLRAIDTYRGTTSGGPNFAYDLCVARVAPEDRAGLDLSSWRLAYSGAEPVRAQTLDRFAEAFAPSGFARASFYPCYGLAEATLMVTGGVPSAGPVVGVFDARALERDTAEPWAATGSEEDQGRALVGCGRRQGDLRLHIVDPNSTVESSHGRVGEIWIAGDSVAAGYWRQPEATERDFGAMLANPLDDGFAGPFLRTGDLGFTDSDGEVYVTGRIKDMVIIRGRNHYPHDLESTAEASHPSLRPGCGAAVALDDGGEERLVVIYEVDRHPSDAPEVIVDTVRRAVAEAHQVQVHDVVLIRAGTVPKTSSGKIQRHACRAAYRDGTLTVVARGASVSRLAEDAEAMVDAELTVDRETVRAWGDDSARTALVTGWLRDRFALLARVPTSAIDPQIPLTGQGLDSLIAVELTNEVEERLGVSLDMSELLEGVSIADMATDVVRRVGESDAVEKADALVEPVAEDANQHRPNPGQEAIWYLDRMAPDAAAYNIGGAARVAALDVVRLEAALGAVVARHPSLRTAFTQTQGVLEAHVADNVSVSVGIDTAPDGATREMRMASFLAAPFDLGSAPLVRVRVFRLSNRASDEVSEADRVDRVALVMHHIVGDFWSLGVMLRELGACYGDASAAALLPTPRTTPAAAARRDRGRLEGALGDQQLAYWRTRLAAPRADLDLPVDRPRPATQTFRGGRVDQRFDQVAAADVHALAATTGTTPYMVLLAAFQTLLHRFAGQNDISVGSPTAGRSGANRAGLVGYFVNPVVLRASLVDDPTFRDLLAQTRETVLGAFAHQDYPFPQLVEHLQPERDPSRSPLFQAMFVWHQDRLPEDRGLAGFALGLGGATVSLGELVLESVPRPEHSAQMDLSLLMAEVDGQLCAGLTYNADLFERATATRLLQHLETLVAGALAAPDQRVSALPILSRADLQALTAWNPSLDEGAATCLHTLVSEQAARTPEAEALVVGDARYTYRALMAAVDGLAARLQAMGVGPEVRVGVCGPRGAALMVGLLGVLRAGGAYVPLDPAYPRERLRFTVDDADVAVLLVDGEVPFDTGDLSVLDLGPFTPTQVGDLAADRSEPDRAAPVVTQAGPDNLAYIIYTSGSTGRPKGVAISHRSAATLVRWGTREFGAEALAGTLAATSICFDLSIFELFLPWATGGRVILADNALALPKLPARNEVTLINTVPSAMAELVAGDRRLPSSVSMVNLAGEPLPGSLARQVFASSEIMALYDLYGPSEDTTYSTGAAVDPDDPREPTIGRAIEGTQAHVVDRALRAVPIGVPGELLLAGAGLARGYLGRPALTAERFIPDPTGAVSGGRVYRTGDLVRWRAGDQADAPGVLLFLGRMDHQVKIRGFRIELGEIEVALGGLTSVEEAVVVARLDPAGESTLVAYILPASADQPPTISDLRAALSKTLPTFMVPSAFVLLDEMPRTPNGKVDRKALPEPSDAAGLGTAAGGGVEPSTDTERAVVEIWREILAVDAVGVTDSFFELGGHSLLAMRVLSEVRETFGVELPTSALLEAPTVAGLAAAIEVAPRAETAAPTASRDLVAGERRPLTHGERALWYTHQLAPTSAAYVMAGAARVHGVLDESALLAGFTALMERHSGLRSVFELVGGQVQARVRDLEPQVIETIEAAEGDDATSALVAFLDRPFDVARGPMVRIGLLEHEDERYFAVSMHHLVGDFWSLSVMLREWTASYCQAIRGEAAAPRGEPSMSMESVALEEEAWLASAAGDESWAFWRDQLSGPLPVLDLPTDHPRPATLSFDGAACAVHLSESVAEGVRRLAVANGITPFVVLMSAFQAFLHRSTGQDDVLVGTPTASRASGALADVLGYLVNPVVVRGDLSGDPSFAELVVRLRGVTMGALAHQQFPFPALAERLQIEHDASRTPLFQALFVWQQERMTEDTGLAVLAMGVAGTTVEVGDLAFSSVDLPPRNAKFDVTLNMSASDDGLVAQLNYNRTLFDPDTAVRMLEQFRILLTAAVAEPELPISRLPLLDDVEARRICTTWNPPLADGVDACLHAAFEAQAQEHPEAIAVVAGTTRVRYRELDEQARRLASSLRRFGVRPEQRVGVCLSRGVDMVVALLGTLRAGGAYVPLDPGYPEERLRVILRASGVDVILIDGTAPAWLSTSNATLIDVAALSAPESEGGNEVVGPQPLPDNLAYVIYTSGSTGEPKGVAISHGNAASMVDWAASVFPAEDLRGVLASTSISFDLSVFELFVPLSRGGTVILADDALSLLNLPASSEVTLVNTVPSVMAELVDHERRLPDSVRTVNLAGEPLTGALARRVFEQSQAGRVFNLYGPSEDTTYSTGATVTRDDEHEPTIGRAIDRSRAFVVDRNGRLAPVGVAGELVLGGAGVARGYLGRAALTAERFVPDSLSAVPGARLYCTGDLVRWRAGSDVDVPGELVFLGRLDHQVKIRGFRIELGEIEAALSRLAGVAEAVVVAQGDPGEDRTLVGYVVGTAEAGELDGVALRDLLSATLPAFMIPPAIIVLESMPLTPNGKVDRKALPAPDGTRLAAVRNEYVAPSTEVEIMLAEIWSEVLSVEKVGVTDSFFELGGHSLLAIRVLSQVQEAFEVELAMQDVLDAPTIEGMAEAIAHGLLADLDEETRALMLAELEG